MVDSKLPTRLDELKQEYELGQDRLLELTQQEAAVRETLLRISGAIQVLEELINSDNSTDSHAGADPETLTVP